MTSGISVEDTGTVVTHDVYRLILVKEYSSDARSTSTGVCIQDGADAIKDRELIARCCNSATPTSGAAYVLRI
jgi:hypothetical protein